MRKRLLVTGGAGFIGSAFVRLSLLPGAAVEQLINLDLLTYASNWEAIKGFEQDPRYRFVRGDINNTGLVEELCRAHSVDTIVHFAAESHVDRSIEDPRLFYRTNVEGTLSLLEVVRRMPYIHFHHVSTDEVYGSIEQGHFTEESPYRPNSPYAASKAASDHLVRAYQTTYGISATLSHSSNNYGPWQHSEKLIPRMIRACLEGRPLPVYGKGDNVRDWIFVEDHVEAIWAILRCGRSGESYNISANQEMRNIDLIHLLVEKLAETQKKPSQEFYDLITSVPDRPGHDFRYALNAEKLKNESGWAPKYPLFEGIQRTIEWTLCNLVLHASSQHA